LITGKMLSEREESEGDRGEKLLFIGSIRYNNVKNDSKMQ
jgi:hypothetical protein